MGVTPEIILARANYFMLGRYHICTSTCIVSFLLLGLANNGVNGNSQTIYSDFHTLMNCIPIIYTKWSLIGFVLGLTTDTVNKIAAEIRTRLSSDNRDFEICCCISMLLVWFNNENAAIQKFVKIIEYPFLSFSSDEIIKLKQIIDSSLKGNLMNICITKSQKPPSPDEHKFNMMLSNVTCKLKKSSSTIDECTSEYLLLSSLDPSVWQNVTDWTQLIKNLKDFNRIYAIDWLKNICDVAQCSEATRIIKDYEEITKERLLTTGILWGIPDSFSHGTVQTKTNGLPQYNTYQHYDIAKQATIKLLECDPKDLMPLSASVGSVSYYWKVSFEFVLHLNLRNTVSQTLMSFCQKADITEFTVTAGTRRETLLLHELVIEESE